MRVEENKLYYVDGTKLHYMGGRFYKYKDEKYDSDLHFHFYSKVTTPLHAHDYFEIFLITHNSVLHTFRGETRELGEGYLCLIAPYEQHQFHQSEGGPVHFNLSMPCAKFKSICDALGDGAYDSLLSGKRFYKMNGREFEYFKQLSEQALTQDKAHADLISRTVVINAITCLLGSSEEQDQRPEWFRQFMERLKSSEYFLKPISELYKLVPYSQPILNSTFKEYEGETLISHLTKMRINYAANLLLCSNYSILDISEQTGYNSLSHFNHTFKKIMGCTPSEYRKKFERS